MTFDEIFKKESTKFTTRPYYNDDGSTASASYWLCNTCEYLAEVLEIITKNPEIEIAEASTNGYEVTLKKHHGFMLRTMFYGFFKALAPYRVDVCAQLHPRGDSPELLQEVEQFIAVIRPLVARVRAENPRWAEFLASEA